jgi:hypothetical protein
VVMGTQIQKNEFINLYTNFDEGDKCEDFIESLQCAMVRAGGCFMPRSRLEQQINPELLGILSKNYIAAKYMKKTD